MAVIYWRGDMPAVAQVTKVTVSGTIGEGSELTFTINGKTLVVSATDDTAASLLQAAVTAWNNSTIAEFEEVTAAYATDDAGDPYMTLTADTAGKPFTVTATGSITVDVDETTPGAAGVNEVQSLYLDGTPTSGTWTITFDPGGGDETSDPIDYDATASEVKTAIVSGMASVDAADLDVTGSGTAADPFLITFKDTYAATNVNQITATTSSLTGEGTVTVNTVREGSAAKGDSIRAVSVNNAGTYVIDVYQGVSYLGQTASIDYNDSLSTILSAVEAVVGSGNVEIFGNTVGSYTFYVLHFIGSKAGLNVYFTVTNTSGTAASITHIHAGGASTQDECYFLEHDGSGGTFTLTFGGSTTAGIAYNASAATIATALQSAGCIAATSDVSIVENGFSTSHAWAIRFTGAHANTNVTDMTANGGSLTGTTSGLVLDKIKDGGAGSVAEIQQVYTNGTGGSFNLTNTTLGTASGLSPSASAGTLQSALNAAWGASAVTVTGSGTSADPWEITFSGSSGTNYATMTGDGTNLTGAISATIATTTAGSAAIGEVQTITLTGATGGTFTLTFKGQTTSALAYNVSAAAMQTALQALSTIGSGNATVSGSGGGPYTVTFASALAGVDQPLITADESGLTGTAAFSPTLTETVASTGPYHADEAGNYSGGSLPTNSDTLVFADTNKDCLYGLDALAAVTLTKLAIRQSYTGKIGLPQYDEDGSYWQYRDKYLEVSATTVEVGHGDGGGSGRIRLDLKAVQATVNVYNTGFPEEDGFKALVLKGTHASNALNVQKGSVDVAPEEGDASTFANVKVSYVDNATSDSDVRLGDNVTLTNVDIGGGRVVVRSATTTIDMYDGELLLLDGAHTAIVAYGGLIDWRTTGEVTNLSASNTFIECSRDPRAKDFNSSNVIQLYKESTINDPMGTLPSGVDIKDNTGDAVLKFPAGKTYQVT